MPRYKLTIAYDGTEFCGWQKQFPHADSVPTAPRMEAEHAGEDVKEDELGAPMALSDQAHEVFTQVIGQTADRTGADARQEPEDQGRPRVELRTVQSVVERAVRHVVREPVILHGASRTDAGVHARGQVGAFTCSDSGGRTGGWPIDRGTEPLVRAINSRLPPDVLIANAAVVGDDFNPITDARRKAYSYTIWTGRDRPLWERNQALHIWQAVDVEAMHRAAQELVGEHDFAAFATAGHGRMTTVRTVYACAVRRVTPEKVLIEIVGSGFLWNMVRIIAGTLVEAGKRRMPEEQIREALRTGVRTLAGPTLPAHGLCLEWIEYALC